MKRLIITLVVLLLFTVSANAQVQYEIVDLGIIGPYGSVNDINNIGQVVGEMGTVSDDVNIFLYQNGVLTDLGKYNNYSVNRAKAINDSGQIVGYSNTTYGESSFLYENGTWTDLGSLGGDRTWAMGINSSGQIVGGTEDTFNGDHTFLYDNGSMIDLVIHSDGRDINNYGQIIGNYYGGFGFIYDNGQITDIGTFEGSTRYSDARAINDLGQVVGYALPSTGSWHAFLYENGNMLDLSTFGGYKSEANDINNQSQIVGDYFFTSDRTYQHAFYYENGQMIDLGTLGGYYSAATAINDYGQIAGFAYDSLNHKHAVLWNPVTFVPEPISSILFITGGVTLGLRSMRFSFFSSTV